MSDSRTCRSSRGLLALFGETIRIDESLMNVATALTAVGPTYIFPVIKALKDEAVRMGLSERDAQFAAAHERLQTAHPALTNPFALLHLSAP